MLSAGQLLHTDITATAAGRPSMLLAQAISRVGASDPTMVTLTVTIPPGYQAVVLTVTGPDQKCLPA